MSAQAFPKIRARRRVLATAARARGAVWQGKADREGQVGAGVDIDDESECKSLGRGVWERKGLFQVVSNEFPPPPTTSSSTIVGVYFARGCETSKGGAGIRNECAGPYRLIEARRPATSRTPQKRRPPSSPLPSTATLAFNIDCRHPRPRPATPEVVHPLDDGPSSLVRPFRGRRRSRNTPQHTRAVANSTPSRRPQGEFRCWQAVVGSFGAGIWGIWDGVVPHVADPSSSSLSAGLTRLDSTSVPSPRLDDGSLDCGRYREDTRTESFKTSALPPKATNASNVNPSAFDPVHNDSTPPVRPLQLHRHRCNTFGRLSALVDFYSGSEEGLGVMVPSEMEGWRELRSSGCGVFGWVQGASDVVWWAFRLECEHCE
ncbi:hypothetical protein NMY22_g17306 [Coprinellus aureogranulatus]|nr:hypothetical protein NMY22_g17306 [Coprinellus aureogranulatus]